MDTLRAGDLCGEIKWEQGMEINQIGMIVCCESQEWSICPVLWHTGGSMGYFFALFSTKQVVERRSGIVALVYGTCRTRLN